MVWNTTQSAFYKAIDDFNNRSEVREEQPPLCDNGVGEKSKADLCGECSKNDRENHSRNDEKILARCEHCPRRRTGALTDIFADKDKLLIAGLIMILSRQNADQKLIMALVFILLT